MYDNQSICGSHLFWNFDLNDGPLAFWAHGSSSSFLRRKK